MVNGKKLNVHIFFVVRCSLKFNRMTKKCTKEILFLFGPIYEMKQSIILHFYHFFMNTHNGFCTWHGIRGSSTSSVKDQTLL